MRGTGDCRPICQLMPSRRPSTGHGVVSRRCATVALNHLYGDVPQGDPVAGPYRDRGGVAS